MEMWSYTFLYIESSGCAAKGRPELRLAVAQAGSRYMGSSANLCGFGWPDNCYKAKCIWPAMLQAVKLIITAELVKQQSIDATVAERKDDIQIHMNASVYILYTSLRSPCVGLHAEWSTGRQQNMGSNGKRELNSCRTLEEVLP